MAGLLDFLQGASNAAASTVSGPVDLISWALRRAGYDVPADQVAGSSEWMARQGLTAQPQNRVAGLLGEAAGMVVPAAAAAKTPEIARGLLALGDALPEASRGGSLVSRGLLESGVIDPAAKRRLIDELTSGQFTERYRLGDVTPGQARHLAELFGKPATGVDVHLSPQGARHILNSRMTRDGFTPEEVADMVGKSMERRSAVQLDPLGKHPRGSLVNSGVRSQDGRRFDAWLPVDRVDDGFEVVSVVPKGLRARNNKAPKR